MDNETKQRIIEFNKKLGLKTEFITDEKGVLGYAQNNTIYINESVEQDYERTNKHEVLHFFENTPEFEDLKQTILSSVDKHLDQIRDEYELRYFGIYSEDEIQAGVLDNEIVIDLLVDNSIIEYENGLIIGDRLLGDIERGLEERRYLNMSVRKNVQNMNLSDWEKIFVENYYDGKEHILPKADKAKGIKREDVIRQDIESYLEQLYAMSEEDFIIDPHSPEIIREYESEIKALQARGEDTSPLEYDKELALQQIADEYSMSLYKEYRHIVEELKELDFEPSFKALMLRETLTKTYKLEKDEEGRKTIVKKRDLHKSIAGHMVLNQETLSFIYEHPKSVQEFSNFANLYFAALEVYNKTTADKSEISFEGVETYGMGQWIKFEGKRSSPEEYLENAERLSALVQDTPWCTKALASSQLANGDFYVFIDNEGKPHLAVRMEGKSIAEVRGIGNGNSQDVEEEYKEVEISFLENNQEVKGGMKWYEKAECNKRLVEYRRKIKENAFTAEDVPQLIEDLCRLKELGHDNNNILEIIKALEETDGTKKIIAEYYGCSEDEIYISSDTLEMGDYVTYGYREHYSDDFESRKVELDKVPISRFRIIIGDVSFYNTKIENADDLIITGYSTYLDEMIKEIGDLEYTKRCIENWRTLGLNAQDIVSLVASTKDKNYIEKCIIDSDLFGFDQTIILDIIKELNDDEFTKKCIESREKIGLENKDIVDLIWSMSNKERTKIAVNEMSRMVRDGEAEYVFFTDYKDEHATSQDGEHRIRVEEGEGWNTYLCFDTGIQYIGIVEISKDGVEFIDAVPLELFLMHGGNLEDVELCSYIDNNNWWRVQDNLDIYGVYEWGIEEAYLAGYEEKIEELGGWNLTNSIKAKSLEHIKNRLESEDLTTGEIFDVSGEQLEMLHKLDEDLYEKLKKMRENLEKKARETVTESLKAKGIQILDNEVIATIKLYDDETEYEIICSIGYDDETESEYYDIVIANELDGASYSYEEILYSRYENKCIDAIRQVLGIEAKTEEKYIDIICQTHDISEISEAIEEITIEQHNEAVGETRGGIEQTKSELDENEPPNLK